MVVAYHILGLAFYTLGAAFYGPVCHNELRENPVRKLM